MTVLLIALGLMISVAGLAGCILPVIPGPPLSYLGLIILSIAQGWEPFSATFLIVMAGVTLLVTVLDFVIPAMGARRYGASRAGVWGSVFGMLAGLIFFPPFGMFIGAFAGAVLGEMAAGKENVRALKAGWGVFVGTILATALKLAASGAMLFYYVKAII
jgi:uncharacterized protein YqgC (DUF456 family)